jgi:RNA polymerase sigma-70 factor (ECF subfamily)
MRESIDGRELEGPGSEADRVMAFQTLAEQHIHEAYKLANSVLASPAAAQDAVHDAFVKAWERWSSLRDPARFDSWFKRIVINTCRDRLREGKHRDAADITDQTDLVGPDPLPDIDERIRVEQALAHLKPEDRILLALRYYGDLKLDDIAELLDVPTGTVKSRLNAAHGRLRSVLERSRGTA